MRKLIENVMWVWRLSGSLGSRINGYIAIPNRQHGTKKLFDMKTVRCARSREVVNVEMALSSRELM